MQWHGGVNQALGPNDSSASQQQGQNMTPVPTSTAGGNFAQQGMAAPPYFPPDLAQNPQLAQQFALFMEQQKNLFFQQQQQQQQHMQQQNMQNMQNMQQHGHHRQQNQQQGLQRQSMESRQPVQHQKRVEREQQSQPVQQTPGSARPQITSEQQEASAAARSIHSPVLDEQSFKADDKAADVEIQKNGNVAAAAEDAKTGISKDAPRPSPSETNLEQGEDDKSILDLNRWPRIPGTAPPKRNVAPATDRYAVIAGKKGSQKSSIHEESMAKRVSRTSGAFPQKDRREQFQDGQDSGPWGQPNRSGRNISRKNQKQGSDGEPRYYQVEFKHPRQEIFVGYDDRFKVGDHVKVEADRGEDLGRLAAIWSHSQFHEWLAQGGQSERSLSKYHKRMLRLATKEELAQKARKEIEEESALQLCRAKAASRKLPMELVGAEYQFDRHKLTFYFEADRRIDFRELVRDLFSVYKTRIWLQQLSQVNRGISLDKTRGDSTRKDSTGSHGRGGKRHGR